MKNKRELFLIFLPILLSIGFILLFLWDNEHITRINTEKFNYIDNGVEYYIDNIEVKKKKLYIIGWAYKYEPNYVNRKILLQNVKNKNEVYELNTSMVQRQDLNEVYDGINYKNCGFMANGVISSKMKNKKYEILILFNDQNENEIFHTNQICEIGG